MRWRKPLLAALVFCAVLEASLQLGALVAAFSGTTAAIPADAPTVVCIGDSFTAGAGATSADASYPLQLQAVLRGRGLDVRVANGGHGGQDSAFLLRRLPGLLQPETRVLCVLLGANDIWSRPEAVPTSELVATAASGDATTRKRFELRWRTGRLLALMTHWTTDAWSRTGDDETAPPASRLTSRRGQAEVLDLAAGFGLLEAHGLISAVVQMPALPPPCPETLRPRIEEAWALFQREDYRGALSLAAAATASHPAAPQAWHVLAVAAYRCGDSDGVERALSHLDEQARSGEPAATESQIQALSGTGRHASALVAARARVAREPRSVFAWHVLQQTSFLVGDWQEFSRAAATTIKLASRASPTDTALVARNYARALADTDGKKSAALVVAATFLDGDVGFSRAAVGALRTRLSLSDYDAALALAPGARESAVAALRDLLAEEYGDRRPAAWTAVLREHLEAMARLAEQHGVHMVLLSYPFLQPELEAVQESVAVALKIPIVHVRERFDLELRSRPRSELFVQDGHCNDAGYALVAEMAAEAIAPLLKR